MPAARPHQRTWPHVLSAAALVLVPGFTLGTLQAASAPPAAAAVRYFRVPAPGNQLRLPLQKPPVTAAVLSVRIADAKYAVRRGDTLSGIATANCRSARDWTGIYAASRGVVGRNPDMIEPGQQLILSCQYDARSLAALPRPAPAAAGPVLMADDRTVPRASSGRTYTAEQVRPQASYAGSGSMQRCIISRESGGNSQIWNATGHYGLYQFSSSTWAAHGGNPADFGHASVAEQNRVYYATVSADGYSDWAPYDGCTP